MSVLINEAYANPITPLWQKSAQYQTYGKFPVIAGTTQTINIPGLTATGLVSVIYLHTNSGGAGQFISNIVPGVNQAVITLGQTGSTTPLQEYIIWQVLAFS
jgi:hypothetical protein